MVEWNQSLLLLIEHSQYYLVVFEWDMKRAVNRLHPGESNPCLRITKYQESKDKKYLELNKVLEIEKLLY